MSAAYLIRLGALCLMGFGLAEVSATGSGQPGSVDLGFNPPLPPNSFVYAVALQPDGKILIGGLFSTVGDLPRANLARLNADGTVDTTFDPAQAADSPAQGAPSGYVNAIAVQPDGRILIGGAFSSSIYSNPSYLTRLNGDGSVDPGFDPSLYLDGVVNAIAVQEDGIILAGGFEIVDGYFRRNLARLFMDGTLDRSFDACVAATAGAGATALALQPDGRILVTGNFVFAGNRYRYGIARVEYCGDLDPTYAPQPGVNGGATAYALALATNGHAFLGGDFYLYHETVRPGIVGLDTNGVLVPEFDPGVGVGGETVYALALQHDQKLLLGGSFSSYNFVPVHSLVRVNPNGSLDDAFDAGTGPDSSISSIAFQNRDILVGGKFTTFNGVARNGLVRLKGDPGPASLGTPTQTGANECQFSFQGEPQIQYAIQASVNLSTWTTITNVTATSNAVTIIDSSPMPQRFYRAKAVF